MVYAHGKGLPLHERAVEVLDELVAGPLAWGLPIFVIGEFLRVVTHPGILHRPSSEKVAVAAVDTILSSSSAQLLTPGERFWEILSEQIMEGRARGNAIHDAQIVAVCLENGARTILSEDRDFRRFPAITLRSLDEP